MLAAPAANNPAETKSFFIVAVDPFLDCLHQFPFKKVFQPVIRGYLIVLIVSRQNNSGRFFNFFLPETCVIDVIIFSVF